MPIADCDPYPIGHFKRVYEHIIKPAVLKAGFTPVRADDILNTNYIAIDVIKHIIKSDMALCDLSSRNPNVFYELGIRQAFNLPVTLMKDTRTSRAFDIQGFRDIEYDENLRIDNVESTTSIIAETLINTYNNKEHEINSLISVLGIKPAKVTENVEISKDTEIILDTLSSLSARLNSIENFLPTNKFLYNSINIGQYNGNWKMVGYENNDLIVGDIVDHHKFGKGRVVSIDGKSSDFKATVNFENVGNKTLLMQFAKLKKLY